MIPAFDVHAYATHKAWAIITGENIGIETVDSMEWKGAK